MEFNQLELEAQKKAAKYVGNMLHTPDKLEKVHQLKWNVTRKKASVEAMLKTAMQSQLDGVKTGLGQLETALAEMKDIKAGMDETEVNIKDLNELTDRLADVRDETSRYSQLATAQENLKHLFTVPETVVNTEAAIVEGKLLDAHKALSELEQSRDDLLFELHKLRQKQYSSVDKDLLNEYFSPVSDLSLKLEKQLKFVLRRTLNTVRKDPKVIVTALRVIEREEKVDAECQSRFKSTGFSPPGRPKAWRTKCMDVLKLNVMERIEGNQLEDREQNTMWLVRHLELIRMITLEDLRVAKTLCVPVFPPSYNILETFIDLYHEALSQRLNEIISLGLQDQEYVTVLQWIIQTYPGEELMSSWNLKIDPKLIKPLLDEKTIEKLQQDYLDKLEGNYRDWMRNALSLEATDWKSSNYPELDENDAYQTSIARTVFQMVDENLTVAASISVELTNKALVRSLEQFIKFSKDYREAILDYKTKYFRDRTTVPCFTLFMIAIVNNCELFQELGQELKTKWWKSGHHDNDFTVKFEQLLNNFISLKSEAANILLDEAFLDIDIHLNKIMTPDWELKAEAIDTVERTLDDYFGDYRYLREKNLEMVTTLAQDRVAKRYIYSLLQPSVNVIRKRVTFERSEQRADVAKKIAKEAEQLQGFFRKVGGDMADFDSPFKAIGATTGSLAEVLGQTDVDMLALDIGSLVKKYPDLSHDQLLCLLNMRGDLKNNEARQMAQEFIPDEPVRSALQAKSIFSQVNVSASTNPFETAASLNPFN